MISYKERSDYTNYTNTNEHHKYDFIAVVPIAIKYTTENQGGTNPSVTGSTLVRPIAVPISAG